jgi:hypothetical protein
MSRLTGIAIEGGKIRPPLASGVRGRGSGVLARSIASPGERAIHVKTALAARASTHGSDVDPPIGNGRRKTWSPLPADPGTCRRPGSGCCCRALSTCRWRRRKALRARYSPTSQSIQSPRRCHLRSHWMTPMEWLRKRNLAPSRPATSKAVANRQNSGNWPGDRASTYHPRPHRTSYRSSTVPVRGTVVKLVVLAFRVSTLASGPVQTTFGHCPVDVPWYLPGLLRSITHIEPPLSATTARKG